MQFLPLALILCSSAVMAVEPQEAINAAASSQIVNPPTFQPIVANGEYTGDFKGDQIIKINGENYLVTYDSHVAGSGRLNFTSFENVAAEGAFATSGKLVIDRFGTFGYTLDLAGRAKYVNNVLNAEGAVHITDHHGQNVDIAANGFLTCYKSNMTCTRVEGSYDVSIVTQWLSYKGKGNVNGVASLVNGNVVFSGAVTSQANGSWKYVNGEVVWVPATTTTEEKKTETKATTTATKKPTSTPTDSAAGVVGTSMMAVVAGVAAFFF
jgi:hypothetical protein